METATKALLLTDVVDSTRLAEQLGDARMATLWAAHDDLARALLPAHHGLEIDKTDGFLLLFDAAEDAAAYAIAYHRALADLSRAQGVELTARAGLHLGEVVLRRNPPDQVARGAKPLEVDGVAKPTAARVMSVAGAGQTLVTDAARAELDPARSVVSHGHWRMKGIAAPQELFEIGDEAAFRPPEDGAKVHRVVRQGDLWVPVKAVPNNLRRPADAFVGRDTDLAGLATRVAASRLVVVLGPGGTGKTRIVTRFAWQWLGDYAGGAWFCDLAEARTLDDVVAAMSRTLDVPLEDGAIDQLGHAIRARGPCLVLLDNFEQIAPLAASTVGRWVELAPEARFVVTSRVVLGLSGEQVFPLDPLPLDTDAVALFEARAQARLPSFAVTAANRADVLAIVRTLDGLPLAIELAAARIAVLPPAKLLERLRQRFKLLAGTAGAKRQATLRAAIDWSWELLVPWERAALAQCSAFEGGFTIEAAEAVLDLSAWDDAPWPMDAVQHLVDKSLLRSFSGRHDIEEPLFGLYVSIHEYAAEKLATEGSFEGSGPQAVQDTWERHGRWYAQMGAPEALAGVEGPNAQSVRAAVAAEFDNLRVACVRAVARGDGDCALNTCGAVWMILGQTGPASLAVELVGAVAALPDLAPHQRLRVLRLYAQALSTQGRLVDAQRVAEEALALPGPPTPGRARLLVLLAGLHGDSARPAECRRLLGLAMDQVRAAPDLRAEAAVRSAIAYRAYVAGEFDRVDEEIERALACAVAVGSWSGECEALNVRGLNRMFRRNLAEGIADLNRAGELAGALGERRMRAVILHNLSVAQFRMGNLAASTALAQEAAVIHEEVGSRLMSARILVLLANSQLVSNDLDGARQNLDRALAIQDEHGELSAALFTRLSRAILDSLSGREGTARPAFEQVAIAAERAENARLAGIARGFLARSFNALGDLDRARQELALAEDLGTRADDAHGLVKVYAVRAVTEALSGDLDAARAALAEAEGRAAAVLAGQETSEVGRFLAEARAAVAGAA